MVSHNHDSRAKREWTENLSPRTLICLRSFSNFSRFVMSDLFLMDGYLGASALKEADSVFIHHDLLNIHSLSQWPTFLMN